MFGVSSGLVGFLHLSSQWLLLGLKCPGSAWPLEVQRPGFSSDTGPRHPYQSWRCRALGIRSPDILHLFVGPSCRCLDLPGGQQKSKACVTNQLNTPPASPLQALWFCLFQAVPQRACPVSLPSHSKAHTKSSALRGNESNGCKVNAFNPKDQSSLETIKCKKPIQYLKDRA